MSEVKKLVVEPTHPLYLFFCWNHDLVKSCLSDLDKSLQNFPVLLVDMRQEDIAMLNNPLNAFLHVLDDTTLHIHVCLVIPAIFKSSCS